jgi:hypothetical protein
VSARKRAIGNRSLALLLSVSVAAPAVALAERAVEAPIPDINAFEAGSADGVPKASLSQSLQVPSGGRPLTFALVKDIPPPLNAALDRSQCRTTDDLLARNPVLIFRPADGYRVMALVTCQAITPYSLAFQFDRSIDVEPSPMTFPLAAPTGGISASQRPGLMNWDPDARTLSAWRGQDFCPSREIRHTYRQGGGELNGFALARIEHRVLRCTTPEAEWQTLWQAPAWNLQQ